MRLRNLCFVMVLWLGIGLLWSASDAQAGYKENFVELLALYYGKVCEAKIEGIFTKTLRIDWTSETVLLHTMKVFSEIGEAKEDLYIDGVRCFKFPNDAGGYNIIDWKTGEMKSVNERAPYFFAD